MNQTVSQKPHSLSLDTRASASLTGVEKVLSYGEDEICLSTSCGRLTVSGAELKIQRFDESDGTLTFSGKVNAIRYAAPKIPFLKRIFR